MKTSQIIMVTWFC